MKQYSITINPYAESDLKIAVDWYAAQKEGLDLDFVEEIGKTLQHIKKNPAQFAFV